MQQNKSYRIRTTPGSEDNTKLNITLNQEYDFIDILSLKLDQKNVYQSPRAEYGCIVGRVIANGGVGVPNARISIFIPVSETTKRNNEKRVLYPYDISSDKNYKNIRYNLFQEDNINECHQVIGIFPLKRAVLDNNNILEVFDEYYKYSTVTNSSGDYMLFGIPSGSNQVHCDIDLSDCGHLSQMPRDMYYKGYSVEQFESSTQFKKDTNLDNLAQVFSEDTSVYVYPFWGNSNEDEVGITRHDINISYRFDTTCIFIGCIVTDGDNATTYTSCLPQDSLGKMKDMTAKQGTIEMIRMEPDGRITNYKIKGNQLIDGDGVWCYQIPMNLDYYTTDEYGNEVLSDNPSIGIPTRTDVRFKIKIEQPEELHKKKACYLVPHNPKSEVEVNYTLGKDTPKHLFVSLFKNNVYSVKSYIPRMQISKSTKTENHLGIKSIQDHGSNLPFPYNGLRAHLPTQFSILCAISAIVIEFMRTWNQFYTTLTTMTCRFRPQVGVRLFNRFIGFCFCIDICRMLASIFCGKESSCMHIDPSWCQYTDILLYPGCFYEVKGDKGCRDKDGKLTGINIRWGECPDGDEGVPTPGCQAIEDDITQTQEALGPDLAYTREASVVWDCVITTLAEGIGIAFFNFSNDWINGALYFPTFNYQKRRKKRRRILGIFGKYKVKHYEDVCSYEDEDEIQKTSGTNVSKSVSQGIMKTKIFKMCSPKFKPNTQRFEMFIDDKQKYRYCYDNMYERTFGGKVKLDKDEKGPINQQRCHEETSWLQIGEPFINREEIDKDENGESIYEYYYRPITKKPSPTTGIIVNLFKTDIILLGSLDICNKHGIWGLYKDLPNTTYQMPGPFYEIDFVLKIDGNKDVLDANESVFIASGKNWGCCGGRNLDAVKRRSEKYRFQSMNNSGGLFYGVGCTRFETKIKTCVNLERICEVGVDLDVYSAIEGVCDVDRHEGNTEVLVTPQGFIGKDQLIRGTEIRQQFATLNQHRLNRYRLEGGDPKDNLISHEGKKYYDFEYVYPTNFDGKLSGIFNDRGLPENQRQTNLRLDHHNTLNESYIDPEYFYFRYGTRTLTQNVALSVEPGKYIDFFQPINSFYFYFGIKSGSTAIEKLRQKFTSKCFQSTDDVVQIQVNVINHPYICYCSDKPLSIPEPSIKIEVIGAMTSYNISIKNSMGEDLNKNNYKGIISNKGTYNHFGDNLEKVNINVDVYSLVVLHDDFKNEGTFFVNFIDEYGNISQSTFTLRFQNKVNFNLVETLPVFDEVSSSVICLPPSTNTPPQQTIFDENGRETCAVVTLENINNIIIKNCKLKDYQLRIIRRQINIGSGAILNINNGTHSLLSRGFKYKIGAYGKIGSGDAYLKVTNINTEGGITSYTIVTEDDNPTTITPETYLNGNYTVENMKIVTPEIVVYSIPEKYYSEYDDVENLSDEERRNWKKFKLYLCEGEYTICLEGKEGNCIGKDVYCDFITIKIQPGISLVFKGGKLLAKYFRPKTVNGITYTPQDNMWWDEFFKFLRGTTGKEDNVLFTEFKDWYSGQFDDTTEDNIREKISLLKEMWMPICSDNIPIVQLDGIGYYPPMRTLLYGAVNIKPPLPLTNTLLCASDTYNSLNKNDDAYRHNDIPYQTQNSTLTGLSDAYRVRNDSGVLYTTPSAANAAAPTNHLTPEKLVFTTSRIPIKEYTNQSGVINYKPGGFYAGVIGQSGAGRAGGYNSSLSTKIKELQTNSLNERDFHKQISALELLYGNINSSGLLTNWPADANKYLFKFHILDQTLKVFKDWNRIAAPFYDYYEPYGCAKRDIPPYFDVFYVNGPLVELTTEVGNSEFDLVNITSTDNILKRVIPEVDYAIKILEELPEDKEPPEGLVFITITSVVPDFRTHLGSCPLLVPNARHIYSTSRYIGAGNIAIEQREITIDKEGNEEVEVLCSNEVVPSLDLEVENRNQRVSTFFTNPNNCSNVTNFYSHSVRVPGMDNGIFNTIINGGNVSDLLNLYDLYHMRYGKPTANCGGTGGTIHWRVTFVETKPNGFESFFSIRKKKSTTNETLKYNVGTLISPVPRWFNILTRGNGYRIGEPSGGYSFLSNSNSNDNSTPPNLSVHVTGSIVGVRITAPPTSTTTRFTWNGTSDLRISIAEITGGGLNGNTPSNTNPRETHSNVGAGIRANFNWSNRLVNAGMVEFGTTNVTVGTTTTTYYYITKINIPTDFIYGSGYVTEPDIRVTLERNDGGTNPWRNVISNQIIGKGILGSNFFDVPNRYNLIFGTPNTTSKETAQKDIIENEQARIPNFIPGTTTEMPGAGTIITGVGRGFQRIRVEDEDGNAEYQNVSIDGALYSYAIFGLETNDTENINILNKRGQLLRESKVKNGKFFWQKKTTVERYDWMSDLFCKRLQDSGINSNSTNPEDLLYYMTEDDWKYRFSYPLYTRNEDGRDYSYADMNPRISEPPTNCSPSELDEFTNGTTKISTDTIYSLRNTGQSLNPRSMATMFIPFYGNISNVTSDSINTMFYTILHNNETHVRAFSQPLDFGNYIFVNESSITYTPNPLNLDRNTVSMEIEIRGTNAYRCFGYDIVIEEGDFHTYRDIVHPIPTLTTPTSIESQKNRGYELFDTNTNSTTEIQIPPGESTPGNSQISRTGLIIGGRWIKLEAQIKTFITRIEGTPQGSPLTPRITVNLTDVSSTDINRIIRISATDATGLEIYTYISLYRWIDKSPQVTHCVYNCNKDIEKALNTGIVIDFEWKDNISKLIGDKVIYLTRTPVFEGTPTTLTAIPNAIMMQGNNLICTNAFGNNPTINATCTKTFNTTDGCTVLSDGETLPRNYRGDLYIWFDTRFDPASLNYVEEDERSKQWLNDNITPRRLSVVASSCYTSYKFIW